jgi:hypothetical protein
MGNPHTLMAIRADNVREWWRDAAGALVDGAEVDEGQQRPYVERR